VTRTNENTDVKMGVDTLDIYGGAAEKMRLDILRAQEHMFSAYVVTRVAD
jgi:hypothetical protein